MAENVLNDHTPSSPIPAFITRFSANANRVDPGHFSIINELVIRVMGRLEMVGYRMPDRGKTGKELCPEISAGKGFAQWLANYHPHAANDHSHYIHWTAKADVSARQYKMHLLPLYIEYIDNVWLPECGPAYFRERDPDALPYLEMLISQPLKKAS